MDDVASLPENGTTVAAVDLVFPLPPADESRLKQIRNNMDDLRAMIFL